MSTNSDVSNVSRRRFLAVAGSVAATSSFAAGNASGLTQSPPPAPDHYLVTIHVRNGAVSYSAKNVGTGLDVSMPNNELTVKIGDEVKWQADTLGAHPKHRGHVHFATGTGTPGTPFARSDFRWSENGTDGDYTIQKGDYYYCVAIFDHGVSEVYADDPKIIVGGALIAKTEVEEAERALREVKERIGAIENTLKDAIKRLE